MYNVLSCFWLQSGNPIQQTRGSMILCLADHPGEDPSAIIKDFEVSKIMYFNKLLFNSMTACVKAAILIACLVIYSLKMSLQCVQEAGAPVSLEEEDSTDIILIEGIPIPTNLGDLSRACCHLLGLTRAFHLRYPRSSNIALRTSKHGH